jgi:predicted enzyme related to lactoylglutathione lyase
MKTAARDGGNDEFATLPRSAPATQRHLEDEMALDLFAGIPVTDYAAALPWYEQFFGGRPSFLPNDTEAVWEVAEHRYIYIVQEPGRAGNALVLSFVDDLDDRVAKIARRGIEPAKRETYDNGVTKVIYRDAEGNEINFGGRLG